MDDDKFLGKLFWMVSGGMLLILIMLSLMMLGNSPQ